MTNSLWERSSSRISRSGREAIALADVEARRLDDNHVGTEHIVLGLLALQDCQAAGVLASLGVTSDAFAGVLEPEEGRSPEGPIPLTPRADRILEIAAEEADRLGDETISTAHVLLGVVGESLEWTKPGPHHLREAGRRLSFTLEDVRRAATASREQVEP
jgi:ATP-dependent Clp protease ATP-binding subunit ClpA